MKISKILSKNDTGESGGHQSGFHIPNTMIHLFPELPRNIKNPRIKLIFKDTLSQEWPFNYIYYNNRRFGGTRDEYRLTCTASYIKRNKLRSGDSISLSQVDGEYFISHAKNHSKKEITKGNKIVISKKWKVIKI